MTSPKRSNRELQAIEERHYFDQFRKDYPLPDGDVDPDGEKPDVIWRGERTIGIEITNFYVEHGSSSASEQRQRGLREQVVSDAQAICQEKYGGRSKLLGFDKAVPIREKNDLANKIADLAARHDRQQTGHIRRDVFRDIPELSFAWLIPGSEDRWQVMQVHTASIMSLERLNEIIKEKEVKSQEYTPCDAYWLLVVVDFFDRGPGPGNFNRGLRYDTLHGL